jgi:hypothetical protein
VIFFFFLIDVLVTSHLDYWSEFFSEEEESEEKVDTIQFININKDLLEIILVASFLVSL